jgi:EPS-associated MarR family transcriptional regulator
VSCGSLPELINYSYYPLYMTNQELEYRALKILERQPDLTQRQLAEELGVSLGKTHYLVKSLIDVGWVKLDNFERSDNKWGYAYLLTPKGIIEKSAITIRFLVRKQREHTQLQEDIAELQEEVRQQQNFSNK